MLGLKSVWVIKEVGKKVFRDARPRGSLAPMDAGICCDVATDVEWKVKSIVSRSVERRLPLSASSPIPLLIGSLIVMLRRGVKPL